MTATSFIVTPMSFCTRRRMRPKIKKNALSLGIQYLASLTRGTALPPAMVCDPAFVAELPGSPGVLLKIGYFDDVGGITHVEI